MNCKFVSSSPKSPFHIISKPNQSARTDIPESISFASQVTKSRISIKSPTAPHGARPTAHIKAFDGTAESPYAVLGIDERGSTLSDIKKAYKKMARQYHPDVSPPDRVDEHTRRFIMVKQAYETLSNPQSRALYGRNSAKGFRTPYQHDQRMEEKAEWKFRWQSQLDELKRRSKNSSRTGRMSWAARMRAQG